EAQSQRAAGRGRSQQAERQRRLHRARPPVRRDRRAHRAPGAARAFAPQQEHRAHHRLRPGRSRRGGRAGEDLNVMANFTYEVTEGVAVITYDMEGESVNMLAPSIGAEFEKHLTQAAGDANVKAVVFTSGKKDSFVAGAKLDWLQTLKTQADGTAASKEGQAGFQRLDAFDKPVVAAIHGACLGGGLEWALACDYRIATDSPKTQLGLPETQLGLLPGAGGTQRLPRLIGAQAALDLILTGKSLKAKKALKLGVVDEVVPAPILKQVAVKRARELADGSMKVQRRDGALAAAAKPKKLRHLARARQQRDVGRAG